MKRTHQIRSVMTTDVAQASPDLPFKAVAALLEERGVGGAPVVDEHGRVLGVVSRGDLLERDVEHHGIGPQARRGRRKAEGLFAADLMSAPAITVSVDDDLRHAAQLMETHRVHRLPVLGEDGTLAGVVSRADLVRVFLRPDNEIRAEVRDEVLEREMCIDPASLYVAVQDGVVTLSGRVERYSMIPVIAALVGRVDGVVEVKEQLRAELDDRSLRPDEPPASGLFGDRSIHHP
ncbi:CBS domain-containing protein [Amycolatopsis benzoatilytica]|uniref:CBS domain-containing protein n=1 Tax=Amycolatopsis benzoatilytica TaxID=346045 RepID=UPI0003800405|nr:CBS domain-containing protein [Amycolatopsis benzoatilytica]